MMLMSRTLQLAGLCVSWEYLILLHPVTEIKIKEQNLIKINIAYDKKQAIHW